MHLAANGAVLTVQGSSLWLCPPHTSPLHPLLSSLIRTTVPSRFPEVSNPPVFPPHITITSDTIPPELPGASSPADWLRAELEPILPAAQDLHARFCGLDSEDFFFRKLTIRVEKGGGVAELARKCREKLVEGGNAEAAKAWVEEKYRPHLSLL
jgi:2',3'-cyclic-nucleotide 3'-phosphodiesterase